MSWKDTAEPLLVRMPAVRRPEGHVPFKRKLAWTGGVLVLYFFLTNVKLFGLDIDASQQVFGRFGSILASGQGSIMQLGIGPIVTASIVLQLLGGANLLGLNTQDDPRDQILYQGLQKLLVIVMICLTGIPMVFAANFLPPDTVVAQSLGIGTTGVQALIFAQMFVGGVLILFMDEVISKWGVGSGIGLFIVAGVSQRLLGGLLSTPFIGNQNGIIYTWYLFLTGQRATGDVLALDGLQTLFLSPNGGRLLALVTTVLIFSIVVYAESVRVEIPLSNARVKGARGRFPVKLIYASVLPMILVRALQANIQFLGRILVSQTGQNGVITLFGTPLPWIGVYS